MAEENGLSSQPAARFSTFVGSVKRLVNAQRSRFTRVAADEEEEEVDPLIVRRASKPPDKQTNGNDSVAQAAAGSSDVQAFGIRLPKIEKTPVVAELMRAGMYVGAAALFGAGLWLTMGSTAGSEFFACFLLEQSLSVDNLFVFILIFKYFRTPLDAQKTALFWGIATAAVLRLVMIVLGVQIIEVFRPVLLLFAGILVFSSFKLLRYGDDGDGSDDLSSNLVVRMCRRVIPVADHYDGDRFVTTRPDGERAYTPLLLALAVIEISDVIFAVDSIPAAFGVTQNVVVLYSANIFAIVSLRAFFAFTAIVLERLHYLEKAVALLLGFIGVKMVAEFFTDHSLPTWATLLVVAGVLSSGVAASLLFPKAPRGEEQGEGAGGGDGGDGSANSDDGGEGGSGGSSGDGGGDSSEGSGREGAGRGGSNGGGAGGRGAASAGMQAGGKDQQGEGIELPAWERV